MSYIFFYFIIFFGNAKFCHVRPVPPYPFWLSDESRSTCPALPCFMLIFFPSASSYAISYFSIKCRFVGQTASLQFYFEYLFFFKAVSRGIYQTKPNHYKMVINCGPNMQIMREREIEIEREREREAVSWEMGERDRAEGSLWIWVCG